MELYWRLQVGEVEECGFDMYLVQGYLVLEEFLPHAPQ